MERALDLARMAGERDEVPVGAVVVDPDGTVVAEDHNRTRERSDPTAHAELLALRAAAALVTDGRLEGHTLYVTLEPCAMCAGALVLARVETLVFGTHDPKTGMCGSLENIAQDVRLNHRVEIVSGPLAEACGRLLTEFFRSRRR